MSSDRFSRRAVLKAMGLSGAMLPLLSTDRVLGAPDGQPKRLLIIGWSNGFWMPDFWPKGTETDFTFGQTLSPLAPYKSDVTVIAGVGQRVHYEANPGALGWGKDQYYGGHDAMPGVLTGVPLSKYADHLEWSGGDSVDQYIAAELAKTVKLPLSSLVVGAWSEGGYHGSISYKGVSPGITPEGDPFRLFKTLFEGRTLPKPQLDALRAERRSILDYLDQSLTGYGKRFGTEDRRKIEAHLESIRALERQLGDPGTTGPACAPPMVGAPFAVRPDGDMKNYPKSVQLQSDLILAAFRCDLTRVATLVLSDAGGDEIVFSWLGNDFTGKGDEYPVRQFHDITHNAGRSPAHIARKIRVDQWYFEQVAHIVKQLKETPEGTGSMLDSTLVVVTNTMGDNHDSKIQPFVLIGSAGGYFKTGRYLKYADFPRGDKNLGDPHNRVLVSLCNAMGVDGSKFGDPKYAQELPRLKA